MNYTDQQFNDLSPYEDNFRTAVEGSWTRRVPLLGQHLILKIYQDASKMRFPFNSGCGTCLVNLLQRAGRLYFDDKREREANKAALAAAIVAEKERAAEKTAEPGTKSEDQVGTKSEKPQEPAKPAAKSAPAPQAKKPSSHHRNRQNKPKK